MLLPLPLLHSLFLLLPCLLLLAHHLLVLLLGSSAAVVLSQYVVIVIVHPHPLLPLRRQAHRLWMPSVSMA